MIVFDLKCPHDHVFEAWFRSSEDYEQQRAQDFIECPCCGATAVSKAPMSPNVGRKSNQTVEHVPQTARQMIADDISLDEIVGAQAFNAPPLPPALQNELDAVMGKIRSYVEQHCDYVGDDFAEEARRIHYGESEARGIYGEATAEESIELMDEGIEIMPLPLGKRSARSDA